MDIRRRAGFLLIAALVCGLATWRVLTLESADAADPAPEASVPVKTAVTRIQDMPIYLNGLATVQPLNVVAIKAQVNGPLIALPAREGAEVHQGDVVAEIDPRPYKAALDQALAQRDEDVASLKAAQLDLTRYQRLEKSSFAPVQQVQDQQGTVDKGIAAVAVDNALIETAQINLGYCVIKSPINGRVGLYQLTLGNLVMASGQSTILSITQDKPISTIITLAEADLQPIQHARTKGPVQVTVFDGSSNKELATGTLTTPDNTIATTTGTISLRADFANQDDHLWPGQFVNTRIRIGTVHNAVTVPDLAVEHGPDGTFVYTVNSNGVAEQTNVQIGDQVAGRTVVTQGLSGHETVIVTGQSRVAPGLHVNATDVSNASSPSSAPPT